MTNEPGEGSDNRSPGVYSDPEKDTPTRLDDRENVVEVIQAALSKLNDISLSSLVQEDQDRLAEARLALARLAEVDDA